MQSSYKRQMKPESNLAEGLSWFRLRTGESRRIGTLDRRAQKSRRIDTWHPAAHLVRARKHSSGRSLIAQSSGIQD